MTVIGVVSTKGGSGKSTSAMAICSELAANSLDVILLDLDPQGTAVRAMPQLAVSVPHASSVADVIAAGAGHEFVVVDPPPGADRRLTATIEASDITVATTGLSPVEIDALLQLVTMVDPDLILPVRFDTRRSIHAHGLRFLQSRFGTRVTVPVPSATAVEWAQANREPLPPLSKPAIAYRDGVVHRVLQLAKVD